MGTSRISYSQFLRHLDRSRKRSPSRSRARIPNPSQPTYSRTWTAWYRRRRLSPPRKGAVLRLLLEALSLGVWDRDAPLKESLPAVQRYLSEHQVVPPSPTILLRFAKTARRKARLHQQNQRADLLASAMKVTLSDSPLAARVRVHHLLRLPPVSRGKPRLPKLEEESTTSGPDRTVEVDGPVGGRSGSGWSRTEVLVELRGDGRGRRSRLLGHPVEAPERPKPPRRGPGRADDGCGTGKLVAVRARDRTDARAGSR